MESDFDSDYDMSGVMDSPLLGRKINETGIVRFKIIKQIKRLYYIKMS